MLTYERAATCCMLFGRLKSRVSGVSWGFLTRPKMRLENGALQTDSRGSLAYNTKALRLVKSSASTLGKSRSQEPAGSSSFECVLRQHSCITALWHSTWRRSKCPSGEKREIRSPVSSHTSQDTTKKTQQGSKQPGFVDASTGAFFGRKLRYFRCCLAVINAREQPELDTHARRTKCS